jgi:phosphohistidine phosphatase SixA
MRFVFIRHGHRDGDSLTPKGREAARRAGEFLRANAIIPDTFFRTSTNRTRETAEIVLEVLGVQRAVHDIRAGFKAGANRAEIESRIAEWATMESTAPRAVAFVGHHPQQSACLRELGGGQIIIPTGNRACVLVFDQVGQDWAAGPCHKGT